MLSSLDKARATLQHFGPGLLVSFTIAIAASFLGEHYGAPVMLYALLLGMAFHFLHQDGRCVAGIDLAAKSVLRVAVGLLGAQITLAQIMSYGLWLPLLAVAGVMLTIGFGLVVARSFGLSGHFGLLTGGAVAICGASAALAIASVLPRSDTSERDTVFTVVGVTALSTLAMIIYPMITAWLGWDDTAAGIFLGATIHDVAQVVGAGFSISEPAGQAATFTKLLRVMLLVPVVLGLAVFFRKGNTGETGGAKPPLFLLAFVALVVLNSLGAIPAPALDAMKQISRWFLVGAIAALGMKTSLKALAQVGGRAVGLIVAETVFLAMLAAGALYMLGH